jgi:hypothetical protein
MKGPAFRRQQREESRDGFFYRTTVAPETDGDRELVGLAGRLGDGIPMYDYEPGHPTPHTVVGIWVPSYKQGEAEELLTQEGFTVQDDPHAEG